jgi:hypothetical protein
MPTEREPLTPSNVKLQAHEAELAEQVTRAAELAAQTEREAAEVTARA